MPFGEVKLNPQVKDIDAFTLDDIELVNYQSHKSLRGDIANIGGFEPAKK